MAKTVQISCQAAATVPYAKIKPFQGELKSLSKESFAKLKGLILRNGVTAPIHVWKSKGELYNLDGHQRCLVFGQLQKEGYKIPPVPIVYVQAKDLKQAKQILLSNVSQYGKVEDEGLYEFLHESGIEFAELVSVFELPKFDLERFGKGYFDQPEEQKPEKPKKTINVEVTCPKCSHKFSMG